MKFFYVYILKSLHKDFIYIGFTHNLVKRFKEHNNKEELSTKHYALFDLIHYEAYRNEKDAKRREEYLKTNRGKTTIKTMLKEYFQEIEHKDSLSSKNKKNCPICGGAGEVWKSSQFYSGYTNLGVCMTCKGKGWIDLI